MTKAEFIEVLRRIDSQTDIFLRGNLPLPRIAEMLALECFLSKVTEDEDTEILRKQVNHLHRVGVFDFKE